MRVEWIIDGRPDGQPINVIPGDQILFTAPGTFIVGRAEIAERKYQLADERNSRLEAERHRLIQQLEKIAAATTFRQALSLAREIVGEPYDPEPA
jgi:hypothetical protein